MKLLLHACCAPCAIYPIKLARNSGFDSINTFFYNPNIHPAQEFKRRSVEVEKLNRRENLNKLEIDYRPEEYFKCINNSYEKDKRCFLCWNLRLEKTARTAKEQNFNAFTTTLLASPYQDHDVLKNICTDFSQKFNITFYYEDFRVGFKDSHQKARLEGIYCQNYCGCIFSLVEREEAKRAKKERIGVGRC